MKVCGIIQRFPNIHTVRLLISCFLPGPSETVLGSSIANHLMSQCVMNDTASDDILVRFEQHMQRRMWYAVQSYAPEPIPTHQIILTHTALQSHSGIVQLGLYICSESKWGSGSIAQQLQKQSALHATTSHAHSRHSRKPIDHLAFFDAPFAFSSPLDAR